MQPHNPMWKIGEIKDREHHYVRSVTFSSLQFLISEYTERKCGAKRQDVGRRREAQTLPQASHTGAFSTENTLNSSTPPPARLDRNAHCEKKVQWCITIFDWKNPPDHILNFSLGTRTSQYVRCGDI